MVKGLMGRGELVRVTQSDRESCQMISWGGVG